MNGFALLCAMWREVDASAHREEKGSVSGSLSSRSGCDASARVSALARVDTRHRGMHSTSRVIALRPRFATVETLSVGTEKWIRGHVVHRCRPSTLKNYRYALAKLIAATKDKAVDDLTQIEVLAALHRLPDRSHSMHWSAWSACLNWLGRKDITKGVKRPKSRRRRVVLETDTLPHWIAALGMGVQHRWLRKQALDVLLLLTLTGMRKGEAISLRWSKCDLKSGIADVFGKTGERRVHLGRIGASIVASQPQRTEYVFASRMKGASLPHLTPQAVNNAMRKVTRRYTEATGFRFPDGLCPHALRHTFASHARAAGVKSETVRQLCGWSTEWMSDRYSHLVDEVRTDVDKVQSRLVAGLRMQLSIVTA